MQPSFSAQARTSTTFHPSSCAMRANVVLPLPGDPVRATLTMGHDRSRLGCRCAPGGVVRPGRRCVPKSRASTHGRHGTEDVDPLVAALVAGVEAIADLLEPALEVLDVRRHLGRVQIGRASCRERVYGWEVAVGFN